MHWSYCSLALSHRYDQGPNSLTTSPSQFRFNQNKNNPPPPLSHTHTHTHWLQFSQHDINARITIRVLTDLSSFAPDGEVRFIQCGSVLWFVNIKQLLILHSHGSCGILGNWSKLRQTETATTKTLTNLNVNRPKSQQTKMWTNQKRQQTKTSTNWKVDQPKRRQTKTSTGQNVYKPKRRQAKTSTHQNFDKPKLQHSIVLYCMLWCTRIFVFIIRGMYCMYIRT